MKVITLLENRSISNEYQHKHGLSLYVETSKHKILFDTGTDASFIDNAKKLNVDLREVDIVVISHGHYDHGGGLKAFLDINTKAKVYIGKEAFREHLVKLLGIFKYNIGMDSKLRSSDRLIFVGDFNRIDEELVLFSNVSGNKLFPKGNSKLLMRIGNGEITQDDFNHEINLVVYEKEKYTLFCGCAHRGIVNIIEKAQDTLESDVETVIGGMHLMGMNPKKTRDKDYLDNLIDTLSNNGVKDYYTGHCTGEEAYEYLSNKMNNINEIKTGMAINI